MKRFLHFVACAAAIVCVCSATQAHAQGQATTLQVIHNSADPTASPVALWVGVPTPGSVQPTFLPAFPNLAFRSATAGLANLAGVPLSGFVGTTIGATVTSVGATAAFPNVYSFGTGIARGANIFIARGVLDTNAFAKNPVSGSNIRFGVISLLDTTVAPVGYTRLVLYHGGTDAGQVDIVVRELNTVAARLVFDQFSVVFVPTEDYTIDVRVAGTNTTLASFSAQLKSRGLGEQRVVICASGFLNPAANRNGASFGLLATVNNTAATPTVFMLPAAAAPPPPTTFPPVSLQAVHASADPNVTPISTWVGVPLAAGTSPVFFPAIPNFQFRTATPRLISLGPTIPLSAAVNLPLTVNFTSTTATSATNPPPLLSLAGTTAQPFSLQNGSNIFIAHGLITPALFAPNPDGRNTSLTLTPIIDTLSSLRFNETQMIFFHAATDASAVEVVEGRSGVPFSSRAQSYADGFISRLLNEDYILQLRRPGTRTIVGEYKLPLRTRSLGGQRVTLMLTGFANPAANRNGQPLGVLAAVNDSAGRYFMLEPNMVSVNTVAANSSKASTNEASVNLTQPPSPNPATSETIVSYAVAEAGRVQLSVANMLGQTVFRYDAGVQGVGTYALPLNVTAWEEGLYTVTVMHSGSAATGRFVVLK